ncbi:glycosyltransferase involved in cell wall biosynthesis [Pseudomonas sp. SJZ079]|uniref:glycosyltransferase n=1 Tax=Pseudomonas sp. SJZ079 TaxID=2572887 RepID=UPI001199985B|nr:glycosyltransferase [Pseudomonas sp. SJZ079]TWC34982.1 glycosyltransferase involved in cell wall biosynthesis [Pseudomonas sp. SJZ079]
MKVLHVSDAIDPSLGGGTAERTFQLALALHRAGADCTVLCTNLGLGEKRRAELQSIELIAVSTLMRRFLVPRISWKRINTLVADADVVHVTGHWSVLGALVCLAALRLGRPYVYCPAGSLRVFGRSAPLKRLYNWLVGKRIVLSASRCLAVTALEREQFHEYGVADSDIVLLANGVHPDPDMVADPQTFRDRYGLADGPLILFLGRLSPIKGPDLLLTAFEKIASQLGSAHLVFAGPDAELGEQLRARVVAAGLSDRVLFTGFLAGQDKQCALVAADLLVVPSRQEAMSLVALEAGLCGTPVLLTDQCGFDEVQNMGGGGVVSVDADELAKAMHAMLQDPQGLRAKGERLRELVLSRYTWDGLTQRALALYCDLKSER